MKIILLRDVAKLGKRFAITTVPDGYATNKLISQGMAEAATPENIKRIMARKDKLTDDTETQTKSFIATCQALRNITVPLTVTANEQGHLFQAIKPTDIVKAVESIGYILPPEAIALKTSIKDVGTHVIALVLRDNIGTVMLEIIKK